MSPRLTAALVAGVLAIATWTVYAPALEYPFLGYDDDRVLLANPMIRAGLSADGVVQSFTSVWEANWAPLTWISHMLDFSLFGTDAGAHHRTSIVLHVLNVLLLFGALRAATGSSWRSGFVAGLLALHPIHVEPVAWISERKGILSSTFALASLWSYVSYGRSGDRGRLNLSTIFLTAGLLCKSMLVSLPLVFLLLDEWPLRRGGAGGLSLRARIVEKWPQFAVVAAASLAALLAQDTAGALSNTDVLPVAPRIANALVSYVTYLATLAWPTGLSVLYPHPNLPGGTPWALGQAAAAAAFLLAVSIVVLRAPQRALRVGWLWYLITLLPAIGLVQVGGQAMADRYVYLPAIGIYLAVTWAIGDRLAAAPRPWRIATVTAAALVLALSGTAARAQVLHWRSSETLFRHASEVTRNFTMHFNLANILKQRGLIEEAIAEYEKAIAIHPGMGRAHFNLANTLLAEDRTEEALDQYRLAAETLPDPRVAQRALGEVLIQRGDLPDALAHYRQQVERQPRSIEARARLGHLLRIAGDYDGAIRQYEVAHEMQPENPGWRQNIEAVEALRRRTADAPEAVAEPAP